MISIREVGRLALEAARRLEDDHVGSEHYLLAVLVEPVLPASMILESTGLASGPIETEIRQGKALSPERVTREYSFDIAEVLPDPILRAAVTDLKSRQPLTTDMAEVLATTRSWPEVTPELLLAEVLSRRHLVATQLVENAGADVGALIELLRGGGTSSSAEG
jgi:hypothetical protein